LVIALEIRGKSKNRITRAKRAAPLDLLMAWQVRLAPNCGRLGAWQQSTRKRPPALHLERDWVIAPHQPIGQLEQLGVGHRVAGCAAAAEPAAVAPKHYGPAIRGNFHTLSDTREFWVNMTFDRQCIDTRQHLRRS
jgi:hypothetical protein